MSNDINNLITILLTVLSLGLTIWTIRIDRKSKEADAEHQEVVKKLTELEWIAKTKEANVLIFFKDMPPANKKTQPDRYLIVRNTGNVEAKNINISITKTDGGDADIRFPNGLAPIDILAPNLEVAFRITLGQIDTDKYIATWSWENPNGSKTKKKSNLTITGLLLSQEFLVW